MPVETQLAIVLYHFGHYRNAAGLSSIVCWAGIGKGTVVIITKGVMTALLHQDMIQENLCMPTEQEKEAAKIWVDRHSCPGWWNGCFFIVSLPNLQIVDIGYGFTGSTHDASAWEKTYVKQEHQNVLRSGEWIWADSAYPISDWVVAPFKHPEHNLPDNQIFNEAVSRLRICSEHAIGFLKGIVDEKSHKLATYWGVSCIIVHNFAMACEEEEWQTNGHVIDDPYASDSFLLEGLEQDYDEDDLDLQMIASQLDNWVHLSEGQKK
ncbi:hypothetical protein GYMLUDRAFT_78333 [Collybiopsis luxurians FD-317 M1]|uniref:DDE Tnp4 domain-containing protein n=1 Tax=Collybiopsis luxurians FD-317 M1 TaxID=944289 RepID=A0A0D0BA07_9AGAR|nr:hypothetical protein GYMLUDRAFT_78333 [Collybiopsis luxurians FD-317 M1]